MDNSKNFIYINNDAGDTDNSICIPASTVCGIEVTTSNNVIAYFKSAKETDTTDVAFVRTDGSDPRPIIESIVNEINNANNSIITLGDDFSNKYIHPDILSVTTIYDPSGDIIFSANTTFSSNATFSSTATFSSSATFGGDITSIASATIASDVTLGTANAHKVEINGKLIKGNIEQVDVDTQSHTLTASEFRSGIVVHTSETGPGVITFDTGANLCSILELEADNEVATCLYINDGNQSVTLNGGTPDGVTYVNNPTIAGESAATLVVRRTAADTVSIYIID